MYEDFDFSEMVTDGDTLEQTDDIIETLRNTEWITEAKQIPVEELADDEKLLIERCINKEQFNEIELEKLQELLAKYRKGIRKQKPAETIKAVEDNIQLFNDERKLIDLYKEADKTNSIEEVLRIGDKEIPVTLYIIPVRDSRAVLDLEDNLSFYTDLTEKEATVYEKFQQNVTMTREEMILAKSVQKKVDKIAKEQTDNVMIEFLSMQTKLNENSTYESMKELYKIMPVEDRSRIFDKVEKKSTLTKKEDEELFQEISD